MIEIPEALELVLVLGSLLVGFVWAPKTWTPGELVTASSMNTNIRDHLNESLRTQTTMTTGTQNNFAIDGVLTHLVCNNSSPLTLTGALVDGGNIDGAKIFLDAINQPVTLSHQDTGSSSDNRFIGSIVGDVLLAQRERALLIYDAGSSSWRVGRIDSAQLSVVVNKLFTNARVRRTTATSINNTTFTAIAFNATRFDDADLHSQATNSQRFTIADAGKYLVGGHIAFASDATGERLIEIREGGSLVHARVYVPANTGGGQTELSVSTLVDMAAADYLELVVWQSSGGALDVTSLGDRSPEFWIHRVD